MSEDILGTQEQAPGAGDQSQGANWAQQNKKPLLLGGVGLAVLVVVLATVFWPSKHLVKADRLESVLLSSQQINRIMGASDMDTLRPLFEPEHLSSTLSKPECLGALTAAQAPTYADSGYTAMRYVGAKEVKGGVKHYVAQSVATFNDADAAVAFVKNSATRWASCSGQDVTVKGGETVTWALNSMVGEPPAISILESRQDVKWTCQRALRAVSNAVVDATACSADVDDQGNTIADQIAANISK